MENGIIIIYQNLINNIKIQIVKKYYCGGVKMLYQIFFSVEGKGLNCDVNE